MTIYQKEVMTTKNAKRRKNEFIWYVFLLPTFIGIVLFLLYPMLEAFRLSFFVSNGTLEKWTGINNYRLVFKSKTFWKAMSNTFFFGFFQLLISIPLGFITACLINSITALKSFFKSLFFIPYVTSIVSAAMIFMFVLHPDMGLVNYFLSIIGLPTSAWLAEPESARWGAVILSVWHEVGFVILICVANLQVIPDQYYEAANIDGANSWQKWIHITIPNMYATFAFLLITGWIGSLQRFSETYILGGLQGSPARSLFTVVAFIYERGFGGNEFGLGSAAAYVLFSIILVFTFINMKITKIKM